MAQKPSAIDRTTGFLFGQPGSVSHLPVNARTTPSCHGPHGRSQTQQARCHGAQSYRVPATISGIHRIGDVRISATTFDLMDARERRHGPPAQPGRLSAFSGERGSRPTTTLTFPSPAVATIRATGTRQAFDGSPMPVTPFHSSTRRASFLRPHLRLRQGCGQPLATQGTRGQRIWGGRYSRQSCLKCGEGPLMRSAKPAAADALRNPCNMSARPRNDAACGPPNSFVNPRT